MAAKIGILGESTAVAVGTNTIYTVPAAKAARVRVLFAFQRTASVSEQAIRLGAPGSENLITYGAPTPSLTMWSGKLTGVAQKSIDIGMQIASLGGGLTSAGDRGTILPYPHDFFLSAGDTVVFQNLTNPLSAALIQVIGVEDDA